MKLRSLSVLGVGLTALSLFAVACGEDDAPAPATNNAGKGGSSAGAAGASAGSGGTAGAAAGAAGAGAGAGGATGGAGGGTPGGAGGGTPGGAGGAAAGAGGGASGKKFGLVTVSQTVSEFVPGTKTISTFGLASFSTATASTGATTCKVTTEGACTISECTTGTGGAGGAAGAGGAPATSNFASAGDITITGLKSEVKLTFKDAATGYNFFSGQAALWDGGETGKFAAVGTAELPAFSGSATAPATIVLSKPAAVALGSKVPVDSAAAFDLAWDVDAKAKINVSISSVAADKAKSTTLSCSFDGAGKTASIPATVTAKLIKGGDATILVGAGNTTVVSSGDFDVNLILQNTVISGLAEIKLLFASFEHESAHGRFGPTTGAPVVAFR